MEEKQNGMYGEEAPRTYGEESKMYENPSDDQQTSGQPNQNYGEGTYGQPEPQYSGQTYNQPNQQYGGETYGQRDPQYNGQTYNQPNYQQPYMNGYGQQMRKAVEDIYCNILLFIMPIREILGMIITYMTFSAMSDMNSLMNGNALNQLSSGTINTLSIISNVLFIAYIIFVVLDIVDVHKGGYKITGLILWAIFLNPGYYIWRAYVLGRDKKWPIIYTVIFAIIKVANVILSFYMSFNMVSGMMQSFY